MAAKKTPEIEAAEGPGLGALGGGLSRKDVAYMIAQATAKAEHHARASVTSNKLQLFSAMARCRACSPTGTTS